MKIAHSTLYSLSIIFSKYVTIISNYIDIYCNYLSMFMKHVDFCPQNGLMFGWASIPPIPPIMLSFIICIWILAKILDCSLNISNPMGNTNMKATINISYKYSHLQSISYYISVYILFNLLHEENQRSFLPNEPTMMNRA